MAEIDSVISAVRSVLSQTGITAERFVSGRKRRYSAPVVAVGLRGGEAVSSGQEEYMGVTGVSSLEVHGRRLDLTLSLDVYSPRAAACGAPACLELFGAVAAAVASFPSGLRVRRLICGETRFDAETDMFLLPVSAQITAMLYAEAEPETEYLDFKVRGVLDS